MSVNQLSNKAYRDNAVYQAFDRYDSTASINGVIPGSRFRKQENGKTVFVGRRDSSGNRIHNDIQFPGRSLVLDGGNNGLLLGQNFFMTNVSGNTFAIRVNFNRFDNFPRLCNAVNSSISLRDTADAIRIASNQVSTIDFASNFVINTWYTIVVLADASGTNNSYRLFVNGAESSSGTQGFSVATDLVNFSRIGRNNGFTTLGVDGEIDWVGFWNRQLTTIEISNLDEGNVPLTDCEFFCPLEEGDDPANSLVYDIVGNRTFTIENSSYPDQFLDDSSIDYSHLNDQGYNVYPELSNNDHFETQSSISDWIGTITNSSTNSVLGEVTYSSLSSANQAIYSGFVDLGLNFGFIILLLSDGRIRLQFYYRRSDQTGGLASINNSVSTGFNDGKFHRIVFHIDCDGVSIFAKLWVDGTEEMSVTIADAIAIDFGDTTTVPFTFSVPNIGELAPNSLVGSVFNATLYNQSRRYTNQEVLDLVNEIDDLNSDKYAEWNFAFRGNSNLIRNTLGNTNHDLNTIAANSDEIFTRVMPAQLLDVQKDFLGNDLYYVDKLGSRAQMVNAQAIILNGVDQTIQFSYQPTNIKLNGVDVTSSWTITDIGGGNWTIEPNTSTTVFDLTINDNQHYPCSEGNLNGLILYDDSGNNNHGIINVNTGSILTIRTATTNFYHNNFSNGYWLYQDLFNNQAFIPIDIGASVVIGGTTYNRQSFIEGYNTTGKWNGQSDFQLSNTPQTPPSLRGNTYTFSQIQTGGQTLINSKTINGLMSNLLIVDTAISTIDKNREFNNT